MVNNFVEPKQRDMRTFVSLAVLACMLWLLKFYWKRRHFFRMASAIPSGKTGVFGLVGDYAGKSLDECFQQMFQYFQEGPEVQKLWFGGYLMVTVSKPEHLEAVLTSKNCLDKTSIIDLLKPYFGHGLITAPVEIWKKNRKLINPAVNLKILNSFIPIFAEKGDILIRNLDKLVGQRNIDIKGIFTKYSLDTICETALGTTVEAQTGDNRYGRALDKFMEILLIRIFNIFYYPQIIFNRTKIGKLSNEMIKEMNDFSQKVITQQKNLFEKKMQGEYVAEQDDGHYTTLLGMLLEQSHKGYHFTDKQLLDEVNTFIAAGTDTTAITLSYCCLMLGMHPEIQEKVYEEAKEVLGEDRYAGKEDLSQLKFTEMFIKETLRIFPAIGFTIRKASDDIKLDDHLVIPKGAFIPLGIIHLHRNPKYWEDPLKFEPNRFLPEEWAKKHPYSYLPFSGGPRNCIGAKYGMMNIKVILSTIVRKFIVKTDYKSVEEVGFSLNLLLSPSNGFKISLERRE